MRGGLRMTDQFGTVTDRLADVIRVITFSRQTGTLIAERSGQQGQEKVSVRFLRGKIIETQATPTYQGADILTWLHNWGLVALNSNMPRSRMPPPLIQTHLHL
ncbi:hypothetical protein KDK_28960 [Dictyobacter kobayashii]|uniref:DUF4388 domain-containing protein n=1 Tax=Dictyobacter kobayashii TaxID=2014872 RepID=A0A402AJ23_9CHLR|nr:hypothetical protein KDK_28960 [Dictyobacter kobayashii]